MNLDAFGSEYGIEHVNFISTHVTKLYNIFGFVWNWQCKRGNTNRPKLAKYETSQPFQFKMFIYFRYAKTAWTHTSIHPYAYIRRTYELRIYIYIYVVSWWVHHSDAIHTTYLCKSFSAFCHSVIFLCFVFSSLAFVKIFSFTLSYLFGTNVHKRSHAIRWIMVVRLITCIYVQTIYSLTECLNYKFFEAQLCSSSVVYFLFFFFGAFHSPLRERLVGYI